MEYSQKQKLYWKQTRNVGRRKYSLFCRVVKLVFVGSAEALLYTSVWPETLHGMQQLLRERLSVLHPSYHVQDHLCITLNTHQPHISSVSSIWVITANTIFASHWTHQPHNISSLSSIRTIMSRNIFISLWTHINHTTLVQCPLSWLSCPGNFFTSVWNHINHKTLAHQNYCCLETECNNIYIAEQFYVSTSKQLYTTVAIMSNPCFT